MKYASAQGFRTALETRLLGSIERSDQTQITRLRKLIVFDRVLSRMASTNHSGWMVKGGVALDLRIGDRARPTQDLDLAISGTSTEVDNSIVDALNAELDDFFKFYVKNAPSIVDKPAALTMSFQIRAELAGRRFEDISIDVGALSDANAAIELIGGRTLLDYAGIDRTVVPIISIEQHLAEKLHACSQVYGNGQRSTRVKDLVDIVLIATLMQPRGTELGEALRATYFDHSGDAPPPCFPMSPANWAAPFRALAIPSELDADITIAQKIAASLFDPVLQGSTKNCIWDSAAQTWSRDQSDQIEPLG